MTIEYLFEVFEIVFWPLTTIEKLELEIDYREEILFEEWRFYDLFWKLEDLILRVGNLLLGIEILFGGWMENWQFVFVLRLRGWFLLLINLQLRICLKNWWLNFYCWLLRIENWRLKIVIENWKLSIADWIFVQRLKIKF